MSLLPLTHPMQCIHAFINEQIQSHCVDCILQYNGNIRHKLLAKSWAMHCSPIMVLFSFLLSSFLYQLHLCILISVQIGSGAVTPMCTQKSTHVLLPPPPPHTHMPHESPLVLFLTVLCAAATFYWWLTTATSKVSLSFDSLICISSLSQHDSAYLCPQAECQCLFSAYKYPPDTVCHVYSWTFLTFDDTLDISPIK